MLAPAGSDIQPAMTDISTLLTRNYTIKIPIVSAAMDTLTEAPMAIAMAMSGGAGIVHRGSSPEWQGEEVARVKFRMSGFIETPKTAHVNMTIDEFLERQAKRELEGKNVFHTFPVVDGEPVVGLVTRTDLKFNMRDKSQPLGAIMTKLEDLIVREPGTGARDAYETLRENKKSVLMLLDQKQRLTGIYLFADLQRMFEEDNTGCNIDTNGKLIVGGAIGTGRDAFARAELLAENGCNIIVVDSAHGDTKDVAETVKYCKKIRGVDVIAGNVATAEGAKRLVQAGADAIKVGIGPGSICTTREVTGFGVPQLSAVHDCARAAGDDIPVIADGGIARSGDIIKALAAGASSCMLGSMLAGTDECPGKRRRINGREMVGYRGMGSRTAIMERSGEERYLQAGMLKNNVAPQGVEGEVPYQGSVERVLGTLIGGIKSGLGYAGARTIRELQQRAIFIRQTVNGVRESHVHDVSIEESKSL